MGIAMYRLRTNAPAGLADEQGNGAADVDADARISSESPAMLVIVSVQAPQDSVKESLLRALGVAGHAVLWSNADKDSLSTLPRNAAAYLLLGSDLARIVGAELPTQTQRNTPIVIADAPSQWRGNPIAKRLLWQALRPLARSLRASSP